MTSPSNVQPAPSRLSAALQTISKNAERLTLIGKSPFLEMLEKHYASYNPGCEQNRYASLAPDFLELGNDDVLFLSGIRLDHPEFAGLLKTLRQSSRSGSLVIECMNPFYFRHLKLRPSDPDKLESDFSIFLRRNDGLISEAGWLKDRQLRSGHEGDAFTRWLEEGSEVFSETALKILGAPFILYRLICEPVRRIGFQAQVLKPVGGVNDVRIVEPLSALSSLPGINAQVSRQESLLPAKEGLERIMILHRPILTFAGSLAGLQKMREAGYLIVTEFDDHPSPWPAIEENRYLTFAGVHAVQTTTPVLAGYLKNHNPEIGIFSNQLNRLPDISERKPEAPVTIFFGALNRQQDWQPIIKDLNQALKTLRHSYWFDIIFDRDFYEALETDHKSFTPQCPYAVYKSRLQSADIALMPLLDTEFNRMKSDLKFVEAAGFGAVPVASPVVYRDCDPQGEFSMICHTPADFGKAVAYLVNHPEDLKVRQQKARTYVKEKRLLSQHLKNRMDWYHSLLDRREELDRSLEERLKVLL